MAPLNADALHTYINNMVLNQPMTSQELQNAQFDLEEVRAMISQQKRI